MTVHLPMISGEGGGGGKKGAGQAADNTLRSRATARFVELISEGPIVGLVDGAKSIYFDQTPLQNKNGKFNFENVTWEERKGNPDDPHLNGNNGVETVTAVDVEVKRDTGPVQRTIVQPDADAVRVIVRLNALFKTDSKGQITTSNVEYVIELRTPGGTWNEVARKTLVKQKCTSPVQFAHRFRLPENGSPWDIRVRKLTAEPEDDKSFNGIVFESYVTLIEGRFVYPHSACVGFTVDAESLGSSIPARSYKIRGRIISVPSNYDAETRTYNGIWNGTFKQSWTNNPAWIFYDLIINDRYGLGEFIPASMVDKWGLYQIAQYCDQSIPSGFKTAGGVTLYEPRFTWNGVLNDREEAFFALQSITTCWRGMGYWALGQVFATADMPADPVKLVTPGNVIGGEFNYSSTAMKARHSVAIVRYNDPEYFYQPSPELVINDEALKRHGWREKQVDFAGCTSRGLAHRYGRWMLDVEQAETETIEYRASFDHMDIRPGNIIAVADPRKASVRRSGRIVSHVGQLLTVDSALDLPAGTARQVVLPRASGELMTIDIIGMPEPNVLALSTAPEQAADGSVFIVTGADVQPRQYRILSINESEENVFQITGLFHDPQKYARIELGINFPPVNYNLESISQPPTGLTAIEQTYTEEGKIQSQVTLSWTPPLATVVREFVVQMQPPAGGLQTVATTKNSSVDIRNLQPGTHEFTVITIDRKGVLSQPATITLDIVGSASLTQMAVSSLVNADDPGSNTFRNSNASIRWVNSFPVGGIDNIEFQPSSPVYAHNIVKVFTLPTNTLLRTAIVRGNEYVYSLEANRADNLLLSQPPARNLRFEVQVVNLAGLVSNPAALFLSNPAPAQIVPTVRVDGQNFDISWPAFNEPDQVGVLVWVSTVNGFNPVTTTPVFDGAGQTFRYFAAASTIYYVRVAVYDSFGKAPGALNISAPIEVTSRDINSLFADAGLAPPRIVSFLPPAGPARVVGELVVLTTDFKIYRWNGSSWLKNTDAADLTGQLDGSRIITGTLDADRIVSGSITAGLLAVGAVKATNMQIDENLTIDAIDAGFSMGKFNASDFEADGLYMGRTATSAGALGFGFLLGKQRSDGLMQYIQHTSDEGLSIINAQYALLADLTPLTSDIVSSQTIILGAGVQTISLTLMGGGAAGAGGFVVSNRLSYVKGADGGATVVQLYDGSTYTGISWSSAGGLGKTTGGAESSTLGKAGAHATSYTDLDGPDGQSTQVYRPATDATGYGSGGGSARVDGAGGGAKSIAKVVNNYDVSNLANPRLVVTIGGKGNGAGQGAYVGGDGSPGIVKLSQAQTAVVPAGVIPLYPTANGSFTKAANAVGDQVFPDLGVGMWVLQESSGNNLNLNSLEISTRGNRIFLQNTSVATFIADKRPDIIVGNANARTIRYMFYKMKV